jgi:8-oxo-dGTP pyrophosphatase MutT (NUDIX family)
MNPQDSQIHCCWVAVSFTGDRLRTRPLVVWVRVPVNRPPSGQELNEGPETPPRPAASVIVLRDSPAGPEVLLVRRNPAQRFMGGAWVFPGGAVNGDESPPETGIRELREEAGLTLHGGAAELVPYSRWITPAEVKLRFDTFFYVVRAPEGAEAAADGEECVAATWMRPADALAAHERSELELVFPTIRHLEQLAEAPSVAAAIEVARAREIVPIQPRIVVADGSASVLLPGEPGFDD